VGFATLVYLEKGVKHCRDENSATVVWLSGHVIVASLCPKADPRPFISFTSGVCRLLALVFHLDDLADVIAQSAKSISCLSELDSKLAQQILLLQISLGYGDLILQCLRQSEMLE